MRIKDIMLQCVGYVSELVNETSEGQEYDPAGTGFFVSVPSKIAPGSYQYFVTAKHIAHSLQGRTIAFIVNTKDGAKAPLQSLIPIWYLHPTTDLAVTVVKNTAGFDALSVSTRSFVSEEVAKVKNIGIGDEVFMVGLFQHAPGTDYNMPIVRMGNIAMIPRDQIYINTGPDSGYVDAYLIEARSIGGVSGSPVFVRPTAYVVGTNELGRSVEVAGIDGGAPYLLGVMQGHWEIKESEINRYDWSHDVKRGVNIGIGVVIPAQRILDLLNDPDLVELREEADRRYLEGLTPQNDSDVK